MPKGESTRERFANGHGDRVTVVVAIGENGQMSGSAITEPKGRATRARNSDASGRSFMGPTMQWVLVVIVGLAIIGGIFYFGRDVRSNFGGGGHSGAPAEVPAVVVDAAGA